MNNGFAPADMRQFLRTPDHADFAFEESEAVRVVLFLIAKEELHAEADAEERHATTHHFVNRLDQARITERAHCVPGRAVAGKANCVGIQHDSGVGGDDRGFAGRFDCSSD